MKNATLNVSGDTLGVTWTGNVWQAPCNGTQHARAKNAMREELRRYLSDCGETMTEEQIAAELKNIKQ